MSAIEAYISLNGSTWTKVDAKDLKLDVNPLERLSFQDLPGNYLLFQNDL